jgi:hypothetical protein
MAAGTRMIVWRCSSVGHGSLRLLRVSAVFGKEHVPAVSHVVTGTETEGLYALSIHDSVRANASVACPAGTPKDAARWRP